METQKIVNLLNGTNNESLKFATRKWYVINDQNNTEYGEGNENYSSNKFETKAIKSNLCDYSDAYILVTGDITATNGDADTRVAFKNPGSVTTADSPSFKYKSNILGNPAADGVLKNAKIVVPLRYLRNFWRSLEMPLINCKIHLELNWTKDCVMSYIAEKQHLK